MRSVFKHEVVDVRSEGDFLVGVLFQYDTVSKNETKVKKGAVVRCTSDAILREHAYPSADLFHSNVAGRILRFYDSGDGKALLCDFKLYRNEDIQRMLNGEMAFSVAWFSDNYEDENGVLAFSDVTIYETSLVANPAFNTCVSTSEDGLSCLNTTCKCGKHSACGCGGQNSVGSGNPIQDKSYIFPMEELQNAIALLQEQIQALSERLAAVEAKLATPSSDTEQIQEAKEAIEKVENNFALHQQAFAKLESDFDQLLKAVSEFVEKATKSVRYA